MHAVYDSVFDQWLIEGTLQRMRVDPPVSGQIQESSETADDGLPHQMSVMYMTHIVYI
jgi:hypothetical protein